MAFFIWFAVGIIIGLVGFLILLITASSKKEIFDVFILQKTGDRILIEKKTKGKLIKKDGIDKLFVKNEIPIKFPSKEYIVYNLYKKGRATIYLLRYENGIYPIKPYIDNQKLLNIEPIPINYADDLATHIRRAEERKKDFLEKYAMIGVGVLFAVFGFVAFIVALHKAGQLDGVIQALNTNANALKELSKQIISGNHTIILK